MDNWWRGFMSRNSEAKSNGRGDRDTVRRHRLFSKNNVPGPTGSTAFPQTNGHNPRNQSNSITVALTSGGPTSPPTTKTPRTKSDKPSLGDRLLGFYRDRESRRSRTTHTSAQSVYPHRNQNANPPVPHQDNFPLVSLTHGDPTNPSHNRARERKSRDYNGSKRPSSAVSGENAIGGAGGEDDNESLRVHEALGVPSGSSKKRHKSGTAVKSHENVELKQRIDNLERDNQQLQDELETQDVERRALETKVREQEAKLGQYSQHTERISEEMKLQYAQASEKYNILSTESRLAKSGYERTIEGLATEKNELEKKLNEKDEQLAVLSQQVSDFEKDMVRLSNERPESDKDDHYFEKEFSKIFAGIQSWVVDYYMYASVDENILQSMSEGMKVSLERRLGSEWVKLLTVNTLEVLQGFLVDEVCRNMFLPVLFGLPKDIGGIFHMMENCAIGTEELTKWRLSTITFLLRHADFETSLSQKLDTLATFIVESLRPLIVNAPIPYKPIPRTRKLRVILEQASKLAIEFQKEPSTFQFLEFEPETECLAAKMADAKGLRDERDLEQTGEKVMMTVLPAVVRKSGMVTEAEEVVLLKAKVLATSTVPGQDGGSGENGVHTEPGQDGDIF